MFKMVSLQQYGDGTVRVNPRREGRTKGENKQYRGICFKKTHTISSFLSFHLVLAWI